MTASDVNVTSAFLEYLQDPDVAVAVAVIKALTGVIYRSEATTMMQMEAELQDAAQQLKTCPLSQHVLDASQRHQNSIATSASCELFLRYVTRAFLEFDDFEICKTQLIARGKLFAETSLSSRKRIAQQGHNFVRNGMVRSHSCS